MVKCPDCANHILKAYPSGKAKLRSPMVVAREDGTVFAVCSICKGEVNLPFKLTEPIPVGLVVEALYVRKK